jgi:ABC-type dipeptide/oligopeptide/nickel transport system permease component
LQEFIIRRSLFTLPVILLVTFVVFIALHLAPGDPIDLLVSPDTTWTSDAVRESYIASLRERLGLDQPLHVQFLTFLSNVFRLDFGNSLYSDRPILEELLPRYQATLELTIFAITVSSLIGITVGVLSAVYANTWFDSLITFVGLAGVSIPTFWLGLMLMLLFALGLGWLPPSGRPASAFTAEGFRFVILPALTLGISSAGFLARITRSQMLDILSEDYIRTARSKGLHGRVVVLKHGLRSALLPIVTVFGLQFGALLAGAVVVETVFAYPGVGRYLLQAVSNRDFPAVQTGTLFVALTFVLVNLLVDVIYAVLDPRIRFS